MRMRRALPKRRPAWASILFPWLKTLRTSSSRWRVRLGSRCSMSFLTALIPITSKRLRRGWRWLVFEHARRLPSRAVLGLGGRRATSDSELVPFQRGYALARAVRAGAGSPIQRPTGHQGVGLQGHARTAVSRTRGIYECASVWPGRPCPSRRATDPTAVRFAQARALGLALISGRGESLLDPASTDLMKETRAFAAELLAPASGILGYLEVLPSVTEQAFDAVAARFNASSWLVQHQYENQILQH